MSKGQVCYFELPATDFNKAQDFYHDLFGWNFAPSDLNPYGDPYWMISTPEDSISGALVVKKAENKGQSPVIYIEVDDMVTCLQNARDKGAEIVINRTQISNDYGYFARFHDLDGNLVGIWSKD